MNNSQRRMQKIILNFILFTSFLYIFTLFITLVKGEEKKCTNILEEIWPYKMTLEDTNAFSGMSFLCRVFGYKCDSNHTTLNSMQQEAMEIYNKYGKMGDYVKIIRKHFREFFEEWICSTKTSPETSFNYRVAEICPKALRCSNPYSYIYCNLNDNCESYSSLT
jgi:hypothetical protein